MQIIGHRGAAGLAPENTLASFERAIQEGVDWIEFDVRATKDGQVIIMHDSHTGRIAKQRLSVHKTSSAQLKKLSTYSGESIPTLLEALQLIDKRAKINIEIKSRHCAKTVAKAIESMVAAGHSYDQFMVSSFYPNILFAIKRHNAKIPLALLEFYLPISLLVSQPLKLKAVGLYHLTISKLNIRLAKQLGLFVYAYTVNDLAEAKRLQKMGVDAVVTNYPDRMPS